MTPHDGCSRCAPKNLADYSDEEINVAVAREIMDGALRDYARDWNWTMTLREWLRAGGGCRAEAGKRPGRAAVFNPLWLTMTPRSFCLQCLRLARREAERDRG